MDFLKAFQEIDTDFSGEITREELQEYMLKNHYKQGLVEKWLEIFDVDDSGTITLEEYCDILGLRIPENYKKQSAPNLNADEEQISNTNVSRTRAAPSTRHSQQATKALSQNPANWTEEDLRKFFIVAKASEMEPAALLDCLRLAREALTQVEQRAGPSITDDDDAGNKPASSVLPLTAAARFIKVKMDARHQPDWQVIVGRRVGNFHASMEHAADSFVVFCDSEKRYGFLVWRTLAVAGPQNASTEGEAVAAAVAGSRDSAATQREGRMQGTFEKGLLGGDFDPLVCEFQELQVL